MADQVTGKIEPSILGGQDIYQFTLDGIATSAQMDRLINLTKDLVKKLVGEGADSLKSLSNQADNAAQSMAAATTATDKFSKAQEDNSRALGESTSFLRNVWTRNFSLALDSSDKALSLFTGAVGFAYTGLTNYSKSLTEGLKRGVAGNTFDLAIAAKSAGVSLTTFTKALGESGGGFASLGDNATDGAMQFGYLVKRVREATSSVGNLGFTNDELAALTAQQTKVAISQGFKGRQAQEAVINNTRMLGKELDNLAARTGKSTLELAQAAAKIAQDPLVASFVKTAKAGSKEVSASIQSLAVSLRGIFGEEGDKVLEDALKTAVSGLPFVVTQTGKNMILASNGMYQEFERLAQKAARGEQVDEQDRQRLRDIAQREVKERGDQLRQFAMLGGPVGESANQILKLAKEAEFYNSEEGKRERRRSDAAKRFNSELNKLQASLQEALIPILQGLNLIDWATVFKVVSYIPMKIAEFVEGFRSFANEFPMLGNVISFFGEMLGKGLGIALGLFTAFGLIATAFTVFNKTLGAIQTVFGSLNKELGVQNTKYGIVGKALDAFAQALNKARSSAISAGSTTGSFGNAPGKRVDLTKLDKTQRLKELRAQGMSPKEALAAYNSESRFAQQARVQELKKAQEATIASQSGLGSFGAMAAREKQIKDAGTIKGKLGSIGDKLTSPKAIGIGLATGVGLDLVSGLAKESGHETLGKGLDVASSAVAMGGTGAMIGSMIAPGVGTAVGAALGGLVGGLTSLWKNFLSEESSSIAKTLADQQLSAAEKAEKESRDSYEATRRTIEELRALREEASYGNQINARGVSYAASSERKLSDLRFTQG